MQAQNLQNAEAAREIIFNLETKSGYALEQSSSQLKKMQRILDR